MDHYNPISSTKSCEHVRTIDFSPLQRLWPLCNFSTFLRALTLPYTHHNHRHMLSEQQQEQRHNGHNGPSQRLHLVTANQKGQMRYSQQVSIILEVSFFHVLAQCHCFLKPFALIYAPLNRSPTIRNTKPRSSWPRLRRPDTWLAITEYHGTMPLLSYAFNTFH